MNASRILTILAVGILALSVGGEGLAATLQDPITPQQQQARDRFIEALRLTEAGNVAAALDAALEGAKLDPDNPDGLNLLGQLHETGGNIDAAVDAYQRAQRADPEWVEPFKNLALLHLRQEQMALALTSLDAAVQIQPDEPELHVYRAIALRASDKPIESMRAFERAWELDPDDANLAIDVALSRSVAGDLRRSIAAAERATELEPDNPQARRTLARLLGSNMAPEYLLRAPAAFREAIKLEPENPGLWAALAAVYRTMAMHPETEEAQLRAIELGLDGSEIWYRLGETIALQKRFADAVVAFDKALELDPELGEVYYARGEANYNLNQPDAAMVDLLEATRRLPGEAKPLLALINIYRVKGDNEQVENYIEQARATGQAPVEVDLATARLRLSQGLNDEALEALERVRREDPTILEAEYLVGQALLKSGRIEEGRAALAAYQTRLAAEKQQSVEQLRAEVDGRTMTYRLRSQVFINEGRLDKALEQLQAAAELDPDQAEVWLLLIQVHEARGDAAAVAAARARLAALQTGS